MTRSRNEEGKVERRRRRSSEMDGTRRHLDVIHKDPGFEYHWFNDNGMRLDDMTKRDDWDMVVSDEEISHGNGATVRRQVGTKPNGDSLFAYLCRKPKEFCDEDRAKKQAVLDEQMSGISSRRRGDAIGMGGHTGYVAAEASIRDGRRS